MNVVAVPARAGRWLDTSVKLAASNLRALTYAGYEGVFRYVPLPNNPARDDIDRTELEIALSLDLQVGLVQHVRAPERGLTGWRPAAHDGAIDAQEAVDHAVYATYALGSTLYLDLEDIVGTAAEAIAFATAWQRTVIAAGFRAGLYVGYAVPLTPEQLYALLGFNTYWSDAGHRKVATRGCAVQQGLSITIAGVPYDEDYVAADMLGELPLVSALAP